MKHKILIQIKHKGFTLKKDGDTYIFCNDAYGPSRKSFGKPVKAKARKGKSSPWIKHKKGKK